MLFSLANIRSAFLLLFLTVIGSLAAQEPPAPRKPAVVGIVNIDLVRAAHPRHRERIARAQEEQDLKRESLKKLRSELTALRAERKKLPPDSAEAKELDAKIEDTVQRERKDLADASKPQLYPGPVHQLTYQEMRDAIKVVCEREKIDLVLPAHDGRDRMLYFSENVDITKIVIAEILKKLEAAKAPAKE